MGRWRLGGEETPQVPPLVPSPPVGVTSRLGVTSRRSAASWGVGAQGGDRDRHWRTGGLGEALDTPGL